MTKSKTTTVLSIIGNGIKLYIQNLFVLTSPVVMPVLGMFLSVILMILPIYLLPIHYPIWTKNFPIFNELPAVLIVVILSLLPGLIVLKLSFWNYMLKLVSLNNIVSDILKRKVLKHHTHYTQVIALRTKDYLLMLLIWCLMILMGLALPLAVFLFDGIDKVFQPYLFIGFEFLAIFLVTILSIYLSLSFQVFAFQTELGPMQTLEESFKLVLNNFWRLMAIVFALTVISTILVPQIFIFLADVLMIKTSIAFPFKIILENAFSNYPELYTQLQTLPMFSAYEAQDKLIFEASKLISISIISSVISLLMLPLGSCFYTIFYFDAQKRLAPKVTTEEKDEKPKKSTKKTKKK